MFLNEGSFGQPELIHELRQFQSDGLECLMARLSQILIGVTCSSGSFCERPSLQHVACERDLPRRQLLGAYFCLLPTSVLLRIATSRSPAHQKPLNISAPKLGSSLRCFLHS